jgi:hypothetical protein
MPVNPASGKHSFAPLKSIDGTRAELNLKESSTMRNVGVQDRV